MEDLIRRDDAIRVASGYCHPANVAKELAKLPSAEPEQLHLQKEQEYMRGWEDGRKNLLEQLPSAQPEIIRCKDCKHWGKRGLCEKWDQYISNEDFYCGCAERRTDE